MATILITGGSGMIGTAVTQMLCESGHSVIILTRNVENKKSASANVSYAQWDIKQQTIDETAIQRSDAIIHLAGANISEKRWTPKRKRQLVESRTQAGALLTKALREIPNNISTVISASATGWYGHDTHASRKEGFKENARPANDFLGTACQAWEESIKPVAALGKRLVIFRFGIVLSTEGGAYVEFERPVKFGIAAVLSSGKQVISWIHISDLSRLLLYALEHPEIEGVYNAVTRKKTTNKELTLQIARQKRGSFFIPVHVPGFVIKLLFGELSTEVLKSVTVNNDKLLNQGFDFTYSSIQEAVKQLESA